MKYELVKQLKDAGFYQDPDEYEIHTPDCKGWGEPSDCTKETRAYVPTLSELIEACGNIEFKIHCYPSRFNRDITNEPWFVIERPNWGDMERCSTPEEAVARLWLALNSKS